MAPSSQFGRRVAEVHVLDMRPKTNIFARRRKVMPVEDMSVTQSKNHRRNIQLVELCLEIKKWKGLAWNYDVDSLPPAQCILEHAIGIIREMNAIRDMHTLELLGQKHQGEATAAAEDDDAAAAGSDEEGPEDDFR